LTVQQRIRQIIVNMERWRWLPQNLGIRYLLVNIAAFNLTVVEEGQTVMQMRVVTGTPCRRTPVFFGPVNISGKSSRSSLIGSLIADGNSRRA
jgi:murein L,D-transpeptidase YcbB/YkuD